MLREEFSRQWAAFCETEWEFGWEMLESPAVTEMLAGVLARLSGRKNAAKL